MNDDAALYETLSVVDETLAMLGENYLIVSLSDPIIAELREAAEDGGPFDHIPLRLRMGSVAAHFVEDGINRAMLNRRRARP